jgi:putative membrane protein
MRGQNAFRAPRVSLPETGRAMAPETQALAKQGRKLAESVETLKDSSAELEDSADRRTELAGDRTLLAAERTYGAWVRTGLLALASGMGAKAALAGVVPEWMIVINASVLVLFSVFCFVAGVWRQLNAYSPPPQPDTPRIHPSFLIVMNGFLALVSIAALFGIWFGRTGTVP